MYPYYYDWNSHYEMEAEKVYPEIYHRIYPHICRMCDREDHPYNYMMYPFPRREMIEKMTDEIYEQVKGDDMYRSPHHHHHGDYSDDYSDDYGHQYHHNPHGQGDVLRGLIGVLLVRELLDRRRRRRRPWVY